MNSHAKSGTYLTQYAQKNRRDSVYTAPTGITYTPAKNTNKGASAEVRKLIANQPNGEDLVVKRLREGNMTNCGMEEFNYLKAAYPDKNIEFFPTAQEDRGFRLIMPYFGSQSLQDIYANKTIWRPIQQRHAYFLKAIIELKRLHANNIFHNDANLSNILFDDADQCHFIDGALRTDLRYSNVGRDIYTLIKYTDYHTSVWGYNYAYLSEKLGTQETPLGNFIYLYPEEKYFQYAVLNLKGKLIKNKLSFDELRKLLAPDNLEQFNTSVEKRRFTNEYITELLPEILEITAQRGETTRHETTYLSAGFRRMFKSCDTLDKMSAVFEYEIKYIQQYLLTFILKLKTDLINLLDKIAGNNTLLQPLLQHLRITLIEYRIPMAEDNAKISATLRGLISFLYQAERITSHTAQGLRFLSTFHSPTQAYQMAKPLFDEIRRDLRMQQIYLPDLIVPANKVICDSNPAYCLTFMAYVKKMETGAPATNPAACHTN